MKRNLLILFGALSIIASSCSNSKIENAIEGVWSMDTIYYGKSDIRFCLSNNIIDFEGDSSSIPIATGICGPVFKRNYDNVANVSIEASDIPNDTIPFRIKFQTQNEIFAGKHKIVFHKDEANQLLKMEVFSDSLYVICRKGLFNYYNNRILINELENLTWTTRPPN